MVVTTTHPEPALLADFGLGKLSDAEAESIEEHLGQCDSCCQQLEEIAADDSFAALVRGCDPGLEPCTEAISLRAAARDTRARNLSDLQGETSRISESVASHPRYAVRELVGIGGMGAVYRASHRLMNREVAIKIIRPEILTRTGAVDRFHREVKAAAMLSHPNIVTAYDAEQVDDRHLLVMEFVEGRNLADEVKVGGPLGVSEACDYIRQAALGLQHAHEQGMVHRDIKPHNLMLTPAGQVKILDFGLASLVVDEVVEEIGDGYDTSTTAASLTKDGTVIGTPDYIAPEQVTDAHAADIRSDIYGLGCTLYCLLTGRPPFADDPVMEKIQSHRDRQPPPIDTLRGDLPPDLVGTIHKMMAKKPDERYQTPTDVAVALAPFTGTKHEIPLRPAEASSSGSRSGFRIRNLLLASLPIFFAAAAAVIYVKTDTGTIAIETHDPNVRVIIEHEGKEVEILDQKSNQQVTLDTGMYSLRLGSDAAAFELSLPEGELFSLKRREQKIVTVRRVKEQAVAEAGRIGRSTVDGNRGVEEPQQPDDVPLVRELEGPGTESVKKPAPLIEDVRFDEHDGYVLALDFTPDGHQLVSGGAEQVFLWDARNGRLVRELDGHDRGVHAAVVLPDGKRAATAGKGPAIVLSDLGTGEVIRRFTGHSGFVECLAVSADGTRLASGSSNWVRKERGDRTVRVWDVENGKELWQAEVPAVSNDTGAVHAVMFTPDGKRLISAHHGPRDGISVWDASSGKLLRRFSGEHSSIKCAALSPDGRTIATGHEAVQVQRLRWDDPVHSVLRLLDLETGREIRRFVGHTGGIQAIDFSPDGTRLLSCSGGQFLNDAYKPHPARDNTLRVWDVVGGRELVRQPLPSGGAFAVFAPDGKSIASAAAENGHFIVQIWRLPDSVENVAGNGDDFEVLQKLAGHTAPVHAVDLTPDGRLAASCDADGHVIAWDVASGQRRFIKKVAADVALSVAVSPDGRYVAGGDGSGNVTIWEATLGRQVQHRVRIRLF